MSFDSVWEKQKLHDLCLKIGSGSTPTGGKESYKQSGISLIRSQNIYNHFFAYEGLAFIDENQAKKLDNVTIQEDDVLLNITGDSVCRCCIVPKEVLPARVNQHVSIIRVDRTKIHPFFVKSILTTNAMQGYMLSLAQAGGTRHALTKGMIQDFDIPVPELNEQKKIVDILSSLDDKIELNNSINKNFEEMAQALFKRWFVDFEFPNENGEPFKSSGGEFEESELGLIPKGWRIGKSTEIFDVQSGGTPRTKVTEYWNGNIPFFTPKDACNSFFVIKTEKNVTDLGLSNCNSKLYKVGTVFITARGTVGKLAMAGKKMAMNQSCYALIAKPDFTQEFVYLKVNDLIKALKKNASGAVFDAITVSTFQNLKTTVPTSDIVSKFNTIISAVYSNILKNVEEIESLINIRDTLLPKLMSGEIRVPLDQA